MHFQAVVTLSILFFLLTTLFADIQILNSPVVITLNRHINRFVETARLMEEAGFTNIRRFEAIDGFHTDDSFFKQLNIYSGNPGQKGCTASHLILWQELAKSEHEEQLLFVCEDDMLPHSQFSTLFPIFWKATPKDFDIVLVGNQIIFEEQADNHNLLISTPAYCTHAYIISKKGAIKLLALYQLIQPSQKDLHVIDIFLSVVMYENRITHYCYNGKIYPDTYNLESGKIRKERASGICFQNLDLGSCIASEEITYE